MVVEMSATSAHFCRHPLISVSFGRVRRRLKDELDLKTSISLNGRPSYKKKKKGFQHAYDEKHKGSAAQNQFERSVCFNVMRTKMPL